MQVTGSQSNGVLGAGGAQASGTDASVNTSSVATNTHNTTGRLLPAINAGLGHGSGGLLVLKYQNVMACQA